MKVGGGIYLLIPIRMGEWASARILKLIVQNGHPKKHPINMYLLVENVCII